MRSKEHISGPRNADARPVERRSATFVAVMAVLAVLSVFAMVVGPARAGFAVGSSPSHSHVFLTAEAAASHSHVDGENEDGVVNLSDNTASSATAHVSLSGVEGSFEELALIDIALMPSADSLYSEPVPRALEEPPQFS